MNLQTLKRLFLDNGCKKVFIKSLSPNDNSKNQVYFGGNFEMLNILPISDVESVEAGDWKRERFKTALNFSWIDDNYCIHRAPNAQLILYPKYPEVRFSGFLSNCDNAPSSLMSQRLEGRLFFIGITSKGEVIGYASGQFSEVSNEYNLLQINEEFGVFKIINLTDEISNKDRLISELTRIHQKDWILSKRLGSAGEILPCNSSNCGGYTLEAELGITPNGFSEPDYLGWEIKQFNVSNFNRIESSVITLMTPEPTNGFYVNSGVEAFIRKYGYEDLNGRQDRMNFGGIHKSGLLHPRTNLKMEIVGFDLETGKIRNAGGEIALIDRNDNIAASWSFSSMLKHWNRKHHQACYVPSLSDKIPERKYKYGDKVILGLRTDFHLFLNQIAIGNIYYDPGIKLENMSTKPKTKRRSQFRVKSCHLNLLYKESEIVNLI